MSIYNDRNLSLKAKGIYFMIETLNNNNEKITQQILCSYTSTGQKAIETGIKELKDKGYLVIEKTNIDGKFIYEYKLLK